MVEFLDGEGEAGIISLDRDDPEMAGMMEIAWRWSGSAREQVRSFANAQPTPEGGTHVLGFCDGVVRALTLTDGNGDCWRQRTLISARTRSARA
jgi:DNA gyrase subunit B